MAGAVIGEQDADGTELLKIGSQKITVSELPS